MGLQSIDSAPEELQAPIREFWPKEEWNNAASVAWLESGWKWDALADTTDTTHPCGSIIAERDGMKISAEISIGYFQINACNYPGWNSGHLYNARQNAGTAHQLWTDAGGSWSPWYFSAQTLGLL